MVRQYLVDLLHRYSPEDQDELLHKQRILEFIDNNPTCFERSLKIGHITASAWLLNKNHSKVLLMHHAKLNMWVQFGGHCDGDPQVLNVALKETIEETGISSIAPVNTEIFDVDVHFIPENPKEKAHYHYDIRFLLHLTKDENFIQNHESKELRWFGKDKALLPTREQSVIRMFDKWLKYSSNASLNSSATT